MGQSHYKILKRTSEIPYVIGGSSQLLVESHRPLGLVRENYWKTGVEAWISRHVELYYITTCLVCSYWRSIWIVPTDY